MLRPLHAQTPPSAHSFPQSFDDCRHRHNRQAGYLPLFQYRARSPLTRLHLSASSAARNRTSAVVAPRPARRDQQPMPDPGRPGSTRRSLPRRGCVSRSPDSGLGRPPQEVRDCRHWSGERSSGRRRRQSPTGLPRWPAPRWPSAADAPSRRAQRLCVDPRPRNGRQCRPDRRSGARADEARGVSDQHRSRDTRRRGGTR